MDESTKTKIIEYAINIGLAIVILVVGKFLAKWVAQGAKTAVAKSPKGEETLNRFVYNITHFVGIIFVVIAALTKLGIATASLVAAVGAMGLAIGLSLQGALSNFAAGLLIIIFRPFKTGDLIDAGGSLGTVREIDLFTTKIITPENKTVIIPNSQLTADSITNLTETDDLRVDMKFGTSYGADVDHVKSVIKRVLDADERILKEPEAFIGMVEHADSSINYVVRPWVKSANYWGVFFDTHEKLKKEFDKENIEIPFPQRDIHIVSDATK